MSKMEDKPIRPQSRHKNGRAKFPEILTPQPFRHQTPRCSQALVAELLVLRSEIRGAGLFFSSRGARPLFRVTQTFPLRTADVPLVCHLMSWFLHECDFMQPFVEASTVPLITIMMQLL